MKLSIFLAVISAFQSMSYSLVGPLIPLEADSKGVSTSMIGFIIGSYSIMYIVTLVICDKNQSKIEKITGLKIGIMLTVVQLYGLGSLKYVESRGAFVTLSVLAQTIGGIGAGFNTFCGLSIITCLYQES